MLTVAPPKPRPPTIQILRECDVGPYCPACGSSQKWPLFGGVIYAMPYLRYALEPLGCINPDCEKSWERTT